MKLRNGKKGKTQNLPIFLSNPNVSKYTRQTILTLTLNYSTILLLAWKSYSEGLSVYNYTALSKITVYFRFLFVRHARCLSPGVLSYTCIFRNKCLKLYLMSFRKAKCSLIHTVNVSLIVVSQNFEQKNSNKPLWLKLLWVSKRACLFHFSNPNLPGNQWIWASGTFDHKISSPSWKMQECPLWSIKACTTGSQVIRHSA